MEMFELYKEIISSDKYIKVKDRAEDLNNWIPIFNFPNGDLFCIDKRNNKIVFFDHELLEDELNLHGLVIANNIYELIEKWSKVSYIDIYDWCEGINEQGIDLDKEVYKNILFN